MRDKLTSIKEHVHNHRAKYAAATATVATASVALGIGVRVGREWNEFLKEYGVYDAFHGIEETTV